MSSWIPVLNLVVQILLFGALVWYTIETWKIRKAAQSQAQAAWEQAEAQHQPCLTIITEAREYIEAVLEAGGAVGGMIVAARNGNVALENMGNGPAVNVRFRFN